MNSGIKNMNNGSYFNLESKLASVLKPVSPNPVFVDSLKSKLSHAPTIMLETSKKNLGLLLLGIGLFTGAITVWIVHWFKSRD